MKNAELLYEDTVRVNTHNYLPTRFTKTLNTYYSNMQHRSNHKCFTMFVTHFRYNYFHQNFFF